MENFLNANATKTSIWGAGSPGGDSGGLALIAVIGSGTMGNGIAHSFAQAGFKVNLIDVNNAQLEKALSTINNNLDRQVAKGTI
ncbi:MAG: NAD(P)-binding domain-containing protein, partial [Ferruginibacter sp.]|nr:NAD(P)-binding domain-containing protein [Ferruginibacter sp.]